MVNHRTGVILVRFPWPCWRETQLLTAHGPKCPVTVNTVPDHAPFREPCRTDSTLATLERLRRATLETPHGIVEIVEPQDDVGIRALARVHESPGVDCPRWFRRRPRERREAE